MNKVWNIIFVLIILITGNSMLFSDSKFYDEALVAYNKGPGYAEEIISLLEKQLEETPKHIESITLLGITFLGTENFDKALRNLEKAIELINETEKLNPELFYLKTLCLYNLKDYYATLNSIPMLYPFFYDSEKWASIEKLNHLSKSNYISYAKMIINEKYNFEAFDSIYLVVDVTSKSKLESDKDVGFFLKNIDIDSESIIVIVLGGSDENSYCVSFNKNHPKFISYVSNKNEKSKDIVVKSNLLNLESNYLSFQEVKIEDKAKYQRIYLTSDQGDKIEAFKVSD